MLADIDQSKVPIPESAPWLVYRSNVCEMEFVRVINEGLPSGPILEQKPDGRYGLPDRPMIEQRDVIRINVLVTSRRGLGAIDAALIWRIVELNSESCDPIGGNVR